MQVIECLVRNTLGVQTVRIVAGSVTCNPRQSDVEYFCVYNSATPDYHAIAQVDRWGGTGGYFHQLMNKPETSEKLREQIKSKRVIF